MPVGAAAVDPLHGSPEGQAPFSFAQGDGSPRFWGDCVGFWASRRSRLGAEDFTTGETHDSPTVRPRAR